MAVATYEDVAVALGRSISTSTEQAQVDWWLAGIELVIATRLGPVAGLNQDVLRYVEVEAVVGKVNRHGTRESSITVAVDDGNVTRRYENAVSADDITDAWWQMLDADSDRGSSSIRPGFEPDGVRWPAANPAAVLDLECWQ